MSLARVLTLVALSLSLLPACSSEVDEPSASGGGGADGGGGDGGGGGGGGAPEGDPGYFACNLPLSCEPVYFHTSAEPASAKACQDELAASGDAGVIIENFVPGPYPYITEQITAFFGDGTAFRQSRHKDCMSCDLEARPWEDATPPELCSVVVQGDPTACTGEPPESCDFVVQYVDCQPFPAHTCDELLAKLPPAGGQ